GAALLAPPDRDGGARPTSSTSADPGRTAPQSFPTDSRHDDANASRLAAPPSPLVGEGGGGGEGWPARRRARLRLHARRGGAVRLPAARLPGRRGGEGRVVDAHRLLALPRPQRRPGALAHVC